MKEIYIGYLQKDKAAAEDIVGALESHGFSCYFAERDLLKDESETVQTVDAISACSIFILVASRKVNKSNEILDLLKIAQSKEKTIFTVFTDLFAVSADLRKALLKTRIFRAHNRNLKYHLKRIVLEVSYLLKKDIFFSEKTDTEQEACNTSDCPLTLSPYNGNKPFIFISYSHRNTEKVLEVVERLQEDGYRVWYDEGIDPGTEWDEFIAEKIEKSSFFIAFMSQEYLDSKNCKDELNYARDLDKDRLLVYLSDVKLAGGMAMRLNRLQAIHEYTHSSFDSFIEKLESTPALEEFRD